jgi:DNA/RNA-binding domain of Phe-tRNA-synthetase-like protein
MGPRRVTQLQRYPHAKRGFLCVGTAAMWVVVLAAGERSGIRPAAFLVPPGSTLVVNEGVWHAGPVPLEDATICEMLEVIGPSDRFDRRSLSDLVDALGVRVLLPEDPSGVEGALDLAAPNAVLLDASLHGRLRLGCLAFEDLRVGEVSEVQKAALGDTAEGLRQMWRHATDLAEVPGVAAGRELYEELGIDLQRFAPRSEGLLDHVLRGGEPPQDHSLAAAMSLCALRVRVPLAAYDAAQAGPQILVRTGSAGEAYPGTGRNRVVVEGRPVLCDPAGPFGSPIGDSRRTLVSEQTERALVVLYLPASADPGAVETLLDGVARTVAEHCGGRAVGRLIVG